MIGTNSFFDSLEEFYADDEKRRFSGEADYGNYWTYTGWTGRWKVSYVHNTGEVYCHRYTTDGFEERKPVEVLGVVETDDQEGFQLIYYRTLNRILDGWAELEDQNIEWVRERIAAHAENHIPRM